MKRLAGFAVVGVAVLAVAASTAVGSHTHIVVGPIKVTGSPDIGTCNNTWASDTFKKVYTITDLPTLGTYNVQVVYKAGTFVTAAGPSPGACESGSNNGHTVSAGITGTMSQEYNGIVVGTLSGTHCTPSVCVDTTSILNTLFKSGWYWVTLPDSGHWTWSNMYKAGKHGKWYDTSVNWPLNDTGDITG